MPELISVQSGDGADGVSLRQELLEQDRLGDVVVAKEPMVAIRFDWKGVV